MVLTQDVLKDKGVVVSAEGAFGSLKWGVLCWEGYDPSGFRVTVMASGLCRCVFRNHTQ